MASRPRECPLLASLEVVGLAPSTWYYRKNHPEMGRDDQPEDEADQAVLETIIEEHPGYGYRRLKPEYEDRTGEVINHKRLLRLLDEANLALLRAVNRPGPNPVQQVLKEHAGRLNLVEGFEPEPLEWLTTDFTEFRWNQGSRKGWLIVLLEQTSRLAVGWAVGPSRNRSLALRAWRQVQATYEALEVELAGTVVHQDQDAVFTSYAWPRAVMLESGCVMSFSENGARENPWIESFWGRMKTRCHSRLVESTSMNELEEVIEEEMTYYNAERRHSSLGNVSPIQHLESEGLSVENVTINRG